MRKLIYFISSMPKGKGECIIFWNRARQKRSVYGDLLPCDLLTPYGRWQLTYAHGIRVQIFYDAYGVDRSFFFLALY